jgi:2-methylcitrate dehydratase PrpD
LGKIWEMENVAVKPYPACHFVHACTDAAIALRSQGIRAGEIVHVRALVPQGVVKTVCEPAANKRRPANSYDAKFSIPYAVATALVRGRFGLAELEEPALRDAQVLALADKVDYEADPNSGFPKWYSGEVVIRLRDGRELAQREQVNRGAADRPLANEEIIAKFMENAQLAVSPARAAEMRDAILSMDGRAVRARELEAVLGT